MSGEPLVVPLHRVLEETYVLCLGLFTLGFEPNELQVGPAIVANLTPHGLWWGVIVRRGPCVLPIALIPLMNDAQAARCASAWGAYCADPPSDAATHRIISNSRVLDKEAAITAALEAEGFELPEPEPGPLTN